MGCASGVAQVEETTCAKALRGKVALAWKEDSVARARRARGEQQEMGWGGGQRTLIRQGLEGADKNGGFMLSGMGCH